MARKGRPPLKRQRLLNAAQERDDMSSDEEVFQADTEPEDEDLGAVDMPSIMLANVEDTAASPDAQPSVQSLPIEPEQQSVPPGAGAEAGRVLLLFDVTGKQPTRLVHCYCACMQGLPACSVPTQGCCLYLDAAHRLWGMQLPSPQLLLATGEVWVKRSGASDNGTRSRVETLAREATKSRDAVKVISHYSFQCPCPAFGSHACCQSRLQTHCNNSGAATGSG